jgi:hypothetical protein
MPRGSRPGERRGGRERGTPNRRTILKDRILAIVTDHPTASQRVFLRKLVTDRKLPAETRIALAPQCFPPKRTRLSRTGRPRALAASPTLQTPGAVPATPNWNPKALGALLGVVQDAAANPKARSKAALKIAEFLLPKVGKKPKVIADEYGFLISPKLSTAYRDIKHELWALGRPSTRNIPAIADKIKKLEAHCDAILRRLEMPCPSKSKYGDKEAAKDVDRWTDISFLRGKEIALSDAQQAEEAHVMTRYALYVASAEAIARRRREALEEADRRFRRYRLTRECYRRPLKRKERNDLKLLRRLYPAESKPDLPWLERDGSEIDRNHPFADEFLAADGNFYPPHSKLRPGGAAGGLLVKTPDVPSYVGELQLKGYKARIFGMLQLEEAKARIYELEKRRVGETLTPADEEELQDLRRRHPRIAQVVSEMNLLFDYWFEQELKVATKAGLDIGAATLQAAIFCLRFEKDGGISKRDLQQLRDDGTWSYRPLASSPTDTAAASAKTSLPLWEGRALPGSPPLGGPLL